MPTYYVDCKQSYGEHGSYQAALKAARDLAREYPDTEVVIRKIVSTHKATATGFKMMESHATKGE